MFFTHTFFTFHCVDDDPVTEEILEANHQALPFHIRTRKELIESITDSALDAYLAEYDATHCEEKARAAYNAKRIELLKLHSLIN